MKKTIAFLLTVAMLFVFAACGKAEKSAKTARVWVLTGPTGIGSVNLWQKSEDKKTEINYTFTAAAAPDEMVAKLSNGEADIAAVATNLASKLYTKTNGNIRVLAVNTLGVLSVLDNTGAAVGGLSDLKGRKIVTTGQGANPQYIIEYLLKKSGVDPKKDVTVEYKADGNELVTVWATDPTAVIIAPCPVSTAITLKYKTAAKVLDLTEEWEKVSPDSELMMGCVIARADFCEKNPETVKTFLKEYRESIKQAISDPENTGALCEKFGIVPKAAVAAKAIPDCHLCFKTGDEMKNGLRGYLKVLFDADPTAVGKLPGDDFWYYE